MQKRKYVVLTAVMIGIVLSSVAFGSKKDKEPPELLIKKQALGTEYRWSQADNKWFWYDASSLQEKSEQYIEMKGFTKDDVTRLKKLQVTVKWYDRDGKLVRESKITPSMLIKNEKRKDFTFQDYYREMKKGFETMRIVVTSEDLDGNTTERSTRVFEEGFPKDKRESLIKDEDPGEISVKRTTGSMMDRDIDSSDALSTSEKKKTARPVK